MIFQVPSHRIMRATATSVMANAALTLACTSALAESSAVSSGASSATAELSEVVVTGSRIAVSSGLQANTPISTVSKDDIERTGALTPEQVLNHMPQFSPYLSQTTPLLSGGGEAELNLRGLGPQRNLVLMDGRRLVPSDLTGAIDINIIPSALVESIETITGGASAVYGSDAMSGVVNFKLKQHFTGVQFDGQWGQTTKSDGGNYQFSVTAGGDFAEGRGNAVISLGYTNRDLLTEASRPFFSGANPNVTIPQGRFLPSVSNLPSQGAVDSAFGAYGYAPGSVLNSRILGFNGGPTLFSTQGPPIANYRGPVNALYQNTGSSLNFITSQFISLIQPMNRDNVFAKADYKINDEVQAYTQIYFNRSEQSTTASGFSGTFNVPATNPFIPADLASLLASRPNPNATFSFSKNFTYENGTRTFDYTFDNYQALFGLRGALGLSDWTWDVYGSHGRTSATFATLNAIDQNAMNTLLSARDGGASLCAGGYNPFGINTSISAACKAYVSRVQKDMTTTVQDAAEATFKGSAGSLPAGDVKVAVTADYRRNSFSFEPDSLSLQPLVQGGTNYTQFANGAERVSEISAEVLVPLLKDLPFMQHLDLDIAGRYSDYNVSGKVGTYKADLNWAIIPEVRLRGGYEHATRAPSVGELFSGGSPQSTFAIGSAASGGGDPCDIKGSARKGPNAAAIVALCEAQGMPAAVVNQYTYAASTVSAQVLGNPQVNPETADTFTFGSVFSPTLGSMPLNLSVDYYDIYIKNVISPLTGAIALQKCFNLDGSNPTYSADNYYCKLFPRDPNSGQFQNIGLPYQNLGGERTSGIDFDSSWRMPLGMFGLGGGERFGVFSFRLSGNYLVSFRQKAAPNSSFQEFVGTVGAVNGSLPTPVLPRVKGVLSIDYTFASKYTIGSTVRYMSSMNDISSVTNPAAHVAGVPAYTYVDFNTSWAITDNISVRGGISNAFNKAPPIVGGTLGTTNSAAYDVIGATYFVGVRAKF